MNKHLIPVLFITLAAMFSGAWTHYSFALAVGAAVLAGLMYYLRILPFDDSGPTKLQQALGFAFIVAMCAGFVLEYRFEWAYWFMQAFSAAASSYFGVIFIMSVVAGWKKK